MRPGPVLIALALVTGACVPADPAATTAPSGGARPTDAPATATSVPDGPLAQQGAPATSVSPAPASPTGPVPCPTTASIRSAAWTTAEGGRSLAVVPHEQLRMCAGPLTRWTGTAPGWEEVVELAGPEADTAAMAQQYECHLRFARSKPTWNLEPWRPHVPAEEIVLAGCNP